MTLFQKGTSSLPLPKTKQLHPPFTNNLIKRLTRSALLLMLVFSLLAFTPPAPVYAASITVDTLADNTNDDGLCSLREALFNANNNNTTHDDCPAGSIGADTITLPSGTIYLDMAAFGGGLVISDDITIEGAGYNATFIDGGVNPINVPSNNYTVVTSTDSVVTLRNLTIQHGSTTSYGGGIHFESGSLTLETARVRSNRAIGLGGGMYILNANLSMTNSDISYNQSQMGGGVAFQDDTTVTDTTLTLERATLEGNIAESAGGIFLENDNGTHTLTNVTISGNTATNNNGAALFRDDDSDAGVVPTVTFINSTITENQAQTVTSPIDGITLEYVKIETVNTIFAGDGNDACSPEVVFASNALSHGSNIASDSSCWFLTENSDMTDTNPRLNPLSAGNVGKVHSISLNSPALDNGNVVYCSTNSIVKDGRDAARPVDGDDDGYSSCDIGAYELTPTIRYVSKTGSDNSGANNCSNSGTPCATIQHAVFYAQDGDHIHIGAGVFKEGNSIAPYSKSLLFKGEGINSTTIDGNNAYQVFFVYGSEKMILREMTVQNGKDNYGGGVYSNGDLETETVLIQNNAANEDGGGVYVDSAGELEMTNTQVSGNQASDGHGGGIFSAGFTQLTNTTIASNHAKNLTSGNGVGGGMYLASDSPYNQFYNVTISSNNADISGDGIFFTGSGETRIIHSTIALNDGDGVQTYANLSFLNSIVSDNTADQCVVSGGAITSEGYNLEGNTSCGFTGTGDQQGADAKILPLGNYGGDVYTHGLHISSPAVDAGIPDADPACESGSDTDARGITRPQDGDNDSTSVCDIGAFELAYDITAPIVVAITRIDDDPSSSNSINFYVGFSMPVAGVGISDFELYAPGITGASVTNVTGGGMIYTVTVNTGTGNGTIRLDVKSDATIFSVSNINLDGLPYTSGEFYTIQKILTAKSVGSQDGWILESGETTNKGGKVTASGTTLNIGDDAGNKQYRAILSFNTALPSGAVITKATLKFKYAGKTGTSPFSTHSKLLVDVKKGTFSNNPALAKGDFNAAANKSALFSLGSSTGWFTKAFSASQFTYINKTGVTQFRLRFTKDDNNDFGADFIKIHSGSATNATYRPQLIIEYYVP